MEDVARGLADASKYGEVIGLTMNMGSGFEISIKKIAEMILEMIGKQSSGISYCDNRPGDVLRLYADSTVFGKVTGWKPGMSFQEGLSRTIEWFKSRPEGIKALLKEEKALNWK